LPAPYRWRDWASKVSTLTGDDLMEFISSQLTNLPDGHERTGLFHTLRGFQGDENPQRAVIGNIFRNTQNRMADGYLLRNVINLIDGIHFNSSEEIHTLGHLYETMLKEMRDAAGDAGEFYTPRPVVRFIVQAVNPRLGETVYDPAAGTGGFLTEAFAHLETQCRTVEDNRTLQERSIVGNEAKALPYLLCQMNLLLHGVESPQVDLTNSLKVRLGEIGEKERVDIILTNPPFGGEEEPSIQNNFPQDKRTSETALLFLQLIMRKLHRFPTPGRAGMVVPNRTLFADGVAARIKEELLAEYNLHTVVRLPVGVFAPYTSIPTNLLFFDASGPTEAIWYYEQPLPEGRKSYTKTQPIQFEEFAPLLAWWEAREENERAWRVPVGDVLRYDENGALLSANLDIKNPNRQEDFAHLPPEQLVRDILDKERQIIALMQEIEQALSVGVTA
jgi:type I restriction enzyme M protein